MFSTWLPPGHAVTRRGRWLQPSNPGTNRVTARPRDRSLLDQPQPQRLRHRGAAGTDAEADVHIVQVTLHRLQPDAQLLSDLLIAHPARGEAQHLLLAMRQRSLHVAAGEIAGMLADTL